MSSPLQQQKALLEEKLHILLRLQDRLHWSLSRLPDVAAANLDEPATSERISAIIDRFCKLQDQLAGSLRHAHTMLGEKQRDFQDVINWATARQVLPSRDAWLELRSLRNRLTHEYDLANDRLPELLALIQEATTVLDSAIERFIQLCDQLNLRGAN